MMGIAASSEQCFVVETRERETVSRGGLRLADNEGEVTQGHSSSGEDEDAQRSDVCSAW
jgi:hypothetical protein